MPSRLSCSLARRCVLLPSVLPDLNFRGGIRFGKLLEDIDAFAGNIAFMHCNDGDPNTKVPVLVTACLDRLDINFPVLDSSPRSPSPLSQPPSCPLKRTAFGGFTPPRAASFALCCPALSLARLGRTSCVRRVFALRGEERRLTGSSDVWPATYGRACVYAYLHVRSCAFVCACVVCARVAAGHPIQHMHRSP